MISFAWALFNMLAGRAFTPGAPSPLQHPDPGGPAPSIGLPLNTSTPAPTVATCRMFMPNDMGLCEYCDAPGADHSMRAREGLAPA